MATPVDHAPRRVYQAEKIRDYPQAPRDGENIITTIFRVALVAISATGGIVTACVSSLGVVIGSYGLQIITSGGAVLGGAVATSAQVLITGLIGLVTLPAAIVAGVLAGINGGRGIYNYFAHAPVEDRS